jgi:hypothetical protein
VCPMQAGCDQQVRLDTVDKLREIIWFHATEPYCMLWGLLHCGKYKTLKFSVPQ